MPFDDGASADMTVLPLISHSASAPLSLRHRMSDRPSPLKSPTPATLHEASGRTATPFAVTSALEVMAAPFMSHTATSPEVLRHRMSLLPSPSKSLSPAALQDAS